MPVKKFRFVSPGVQVKEIDKSQLAAAPQAIGPVVVGRTLRGPGMVPVTVNSYEEFVEKFGAPDRGAGSSDVWRNGNTTAPTYAAYAAEAYLKNSSPLTMVRLMGTEHPDAIADSGEAGWSTDNAAADPSSATNGGAYGLFIIPSASAYTNVTGALAAVFYLDEGSLKLKGKKPGSAVATSGSSVLIANSGDDFEFTLQIGSGSSEETVAFNFNPSSAKYIRKVLNTNPTLTNDEVTPASSLKHYWLGETFETHLKEVVSSDDVFGFIAAIEQSTGDQINLADHKGNQAEPGKSGWIIGQHLNSDTGSFAPAQQEKLFRLVASEGLGGDWEQNNIKISILDIKKSPSVFEKYGSFTVAVRKIDDTDANPEFVEAFPNCNLNPSSPNYVAARIGDRHLVWDDTEGRHKEIGDFPNLSRYVRVEMNPVAEQGGLDPELLPFGFFSHPKIKDISLNGGVSGVQPSSDSFVLIGSASMPDAPSGSALDVGNINSVTFSAKLKFPEMKMRVTSSDAGVLDISQAFFGVVPNAGTVLPQSRLNEDFRDLTRAKPNGIDSYDADNIITEDSSVFSLDDVVVTSSVAKGTFSYWEAGSRVAGDSLTAKSGSYEDILDAGHNRFTLPLFGGTDGLDIKEREPFRNSLTEGKTRVENYAVNTLYRAIDSVKEPEVLNMNLLLLPGITNEAITKYAIDVCEQRSDALAIIDLKGGYEPSSENNSAETLRLGSVSKTVTNIKARNLNSSYGCAYYPWVKVLDTESGAPLWLPPSVVALGTMASSQENSQIWFAPAGFNRGGLSLGSSGLSVTGVREKLTSKQRDSLYEVSINPIASFPSEGIVIFGQKTLQATPSALDRINVRRLVIFLKKQISIIASGLLFEPNVEATWNRFKKPATSILESVKNGFGISEYKLVLDSTTTTPEEIDRNIMYAKLFIKPVYAIEFIGIDFIITNTGASFEDL